MGRTSDPFSGAGKSTEVACVLAFSTKTPGPAFTTDRSSLDLKGV